MCMIISHSYSVLAVCDGKLLLTMDVATHIVLGVLFLLILLIAFLVVCLLVHAAIILIFYRLTISFLDDSANLEISMRMTYTFSLTSLIASGLTRKCRQWMQKKSRKWFV